MIDELFVALANVSDELLPILGALALIFLCVLLKKLCNVVDSLNQTVKNLDPTIQLVDKSIEKVQAPLDTAVKYSHSLDKVHDKTAEVFGKATDFASDNINKLQDLVDRKTGEENRPADEEVSDEH